MRPGIVALWVVCVILLGTVPGRADRRVALVIGNSNYINAGQLANPVNDGAAVAALTAVSGIVALAHHPELSLPVPPALSVGVGLYLVFRTAIASPTFGAPKKKGFIP